ncbi:MAG: 8-amino-7-oxononanoate synthase [Deltaproteobacteria bacterium]|nr:8-amino-7-oxononanoate synthase [Deltaproteobacteria bacterium]
MNSFITEELERINAAGLKRAMRVVTGTQGPSVTVDGREAVLLCSNDYLGLANHPLVKEAAKRAIDRYGFGAGASRLVSGNMEPHAELEERIRRFKGTGAALLFNSGYQTNIGLISALSDRSTAVFSDRLNHASIVDACRLSFAGVHRYPNRDVDSLERLLKKSAAKNKLIVTDGVFSMDGSIAPLKEIAGLLDRHNALLIVDDAHATGVLGKTGRGTPEHLGVTHPSVIHMGTLGKALGSFGAYVAGSKSLIELLISKARPFIYTTALPPSMASASIAAFDVMENEPSLRDKLWENVEFFKRGLPEGIETLGSPTQIIPIVVGDASRTMEISKNLLEKGVFIQGIRPPTVPEKTSRLRVTITAAHGSEDLRKALAAIKEELAR